MFKANSLLCVDFVLTERFCQDPVQEYFGNQHKLGRRTDNPDIWQFGANTIFKCKYNMYTGPFDARVDIQEKRKTKEKHGGMFLMTQCPVEQQHAGFRNRIVL